MLLFVLIALMSLYNVRLQSPSPIIPSETTGSIVQQRFDSIDLSIIYDNDIFNTYKLEIKKPKKPDYTTPVPPPPSPISVPAPKVIQTKFLDPLPITLTGIFMFNNDALNRAIILDNKTKKELTYKIGDELEDAQLVKIFSNKILLIRANGQQEMLYLSQEDATIDSLPQEKKDWSHIVRPLQPNKYLVDCQEFAFEVKSLSNFIDLFDLSTAYKQGKSIGSKIGKTDDKSLANALGFMPGDIITKVSGTDATTTSERLSIFKKIISLPENGIIKITFMRNNEPSSVDIKLGTISPIPPIPYFLGPEIKKEKQTQQEQKDHDDELEAQQIEVLKQKEQFAPTLRNLQQHEKENILRHQNDRTEGDQ